MQLKLELEKQDPVRRTWESVDDEQRQAIINRLSRLIVQAAVQGQEEDSSDDD